MKAIAAAFYDSTGSSTSYSVDTKAVGTEGFALWANFPLNSSNFGIQAEFGLLFNNGTELNGEVKSGNAKLEITDQYSYTSLELPVLLTYTVNKGGFFEFIPQGGFYISYPI